ncbi:MAG: substrate-binding domain-containing protein [Pirellulales bacterium]|nr:substrate-binding domain-containing protein [Pirellulales bacterium]
MREPFRIALIMSLDIAYCRGVLRGIHAYSAHKAHWIFRDGTPDRRILKPLLEWQPHGVIVHLAERSLVEPISELPMPVVNTTSTFDDVRLPLVEVDHHEVGRLAAEHFLDRGFTRFGYFGSGWTGFSRQREEGFRKTLAKTGYDVSSCYADFMPRPPAESSWKEVDTRVADWLSSLSRPTAILASNDIPARQLSYMCRQLELRVPDEIAILGVDNDELECILATPPLSTVVNPSEKIGYQAAELLDKLIHGAPRPNVSITIRPDRIITRQSTDTVAINDPDVAGAVAFIRSHVSEGIGVGDVVQAVSLSRRKLERKFRQLLGRTLLEELQKARVETAKRLLVESDMLMPMVARRSGFSTTGRLSVVFRQFTGVTPTEYRRNWQMSR